MLWKWWLGNYIVLTFSVSYHWSLPGTGNIAAAHTPRFTAANFVLLPKHLRIGSHHINCVQNQFTIEIKIQTLKQGDLLEVVVKMSLLLQFSTTNCDFGCFPRYSYSQNLKNWSIVIRLVLTKQHGSGKLFDSWAVMWRPKVFSYCTCVVAVPTDWQLTYCDRSWQKILIKNLIICHKLFGHVTSLNLFFI